MYFGFIFEGRNHQYSVNAEKARRDPYEALQEANELWDNTPDIHQARLLVLKRTDNINDENNYAWFQFTSREACLRFCNNRDRIEWSQKENSKWNGDASFMT